VIWEFRWYQGNEYSNSNEQDKRISTRTRKDKVSGGAREKDQIEKNERQREGNPREAAKGGTGEEMGGELATVA